MIKVLLSMRTGCTEQDDRMQADQLPDIFTKSLDYPKFKVMLDNIRNFAS